MSAALAAGKAELTGKVTEKGRGGARAAARQRHKKARKIFRRAVGSLLAAGVGECHILLAQARVFLGFALEKLGLRAAATYTLVIRGASVCIMGQ